MHVVAQAPAQRRVQQVGGGVVAGGGVAGGAIDVGVHALAGLERRRARARARTTWSVPRRMTSVTRGAAAAALALEHARCRPPDRRRWRRTATPRSLTSTLAVVGRLDGPDRGLGVGRLIADELGGEARRRPTARPPARAWPSPRALAAGALARAGALLLHERLEARLVDAEAVLGDDLERQVDREAVGVVQQERVGRGDPLVAPVARAGDQLIQALEPLLERAAEALLLGGHPAADRVALRRASSG